MVAFVRSEYRIVRESPDEIRIRLFFGDDQERAQVLILTLETGEDGGEWVQIATPFARVGQVDLGLLLAEVGSSTVVGGLVVMGEYIVLRHTLPLVNLDINEFVEPVELIAGSADLLEQQFLGGDNY